MLANLIRRRWPIPVIALLLVVGVIGVSLWATSSDQDTLVIYNGRAHYGTEQVFADFSEATGIDVEIRGGNAAELYDRLRAEGEDTPADVLITTDLANLWRAEDAGLLRGVTSSTLQENVPEGLHDPDGVWWALTTRVRIPVVSTDRVEEGAVTSYDDLGDPQWDGRLCLRTSTSEYNQSLVADMIAKRGADETEELLRSWFANDPTVVNSDGDLLSAIAAGECDVGLVNHYYLARALLEDPDFPVAPAWPDQDGAGAHANVSGIGMVRWSDADDDVLTLMEYLTSAAAQVQIAEGGEFPANPEVPPEPHIADWAAVVLDPIAVDEAGPLLDGAVAMMLEVGWN